MAPTTNYQNTIGTSGTYTVAVTQRAGTINEEQHLGFVYAVSITSGGTTTEVITVPALPEGCVRANTAGLAVLRALKTVQGN